MGEKEQRYPNPINIHRSKGEWCWFLSTDRLINTEDHGGAIGGNTGKKDGKKRRSLLLPDDEVEEVLYKRCVAVMDGHY